MGKIENEDLITHENCNYAFYLEDAYFQQIFAGDEEVLASADTQFKRFCDFFEDSIGLNEDVHINLHKWLAVGVERETLRMAIQYGVGSVLFTLFAYLNINDGLDALDPDKDVMDHCTKIIKKLKGITEEYTLKMKFPMIYENYCYFLHKVKHINDIKKKYRNNPEKWAEAFTNIAVMNNLTFEEITGLITRKVDTSVAAYTKMYARKCSRILEMVPEFNKFLETTEVDLSTASGESLEKLNLFFVEGALSVIELGGNKNFPWHLEYVANYFDSNEDRKNNDDIKIFRIATNCEDDLDKVIDEQYSGEITPRIVYERYLNVLANQDSQGQGQKISSTDAVQYVKKD